MAKKKLNLLRTPMDEPAFVASSAKDIAWVGDPLTDEAGACQGCNGSGFWFDRGGEEHNCDEPNCPAFLRRIADALRRLTTTVLRAESGGWVCGVCRYTVSDMSAPPTEHRYDCAWRLAKERP